MMSLRSEDGVRWKLSEKALHYYISIQRNRAVVYSVALSVALIYLLVVGKFAEQWDAAISILVIALISSWLITLYYKRRLESRGPVLNLHFLWITIDAVCITWGIHLTGEYSHVWFPWYLANISGAAFALGQKGGLFAAVVDTICYELLIVIVNGGSPPEGMLVLVFFRMICLYGASVFFLKGATDLQKKRETIKRMREADAAKVRELTLLTDKLNRRSGELAAANLRIREADHMKSVFLANMSHELRTPLNSIIGFSEVLTAKLDGTIDQKLLGFIDNIYHSGKHLLSIINDILDLSKIEAGKGEILPSEVDPVSLVESVLEVIKGTSRQRNVKVEISRPDKVPEMYGDAAKIKQILYNLLSNAVKFSYNGGLVTVSVGELKADESPLDTDSVFFSVKDEGIGIDPGSHKRIFKEFEQADNSLTRAQGGTGLGLAITSKLVKLHCGKITMTSALGKGSTFQVILPAKLDMKNVPELGVTIRDVEQTESLPRILVVEDDPGAYEKIAEVLSLGGFCPVRARRGEDVPGIIQDESPRAVILDIVLPGIDGWEVLKELRQDPDTERLPVIIVSIQENRELGFALGADDYFVKPVSLDDLMIRLDKLLSGRKNGKWNILLIDDDSAFHDLMQEKLPESEYNLMHAHTGRQGTEKAVKESIDLIVLDLMMEGMDGFEVASFLKRHPETGNIPVLILTAKDLTGEDREKLTGKIDALVQKGPEGLSGLRALVEKLLVGGGSGGNNE